MRTRLLHTSQRGQAGFTLIEVVLACAVLMIGLVALGLTLVASGSLMRAAEERSQAQGAVHSVVRQIQAVSSTSIAAPAGWSQTMVDSFAAGGQFGDTFPVRGLTSANGQPATATVRVVTDETLTDLELGTNIGMPRDLNGDGIANSMDVTPDARLLPVVVTVRWSGKFGDRQIVQSFFLLGA